MLLEEVQKNLHMVGGIPPCDLYPIGVICLKEKIIA